MQLSIADAYRERDWKVHNIGDSKVGPQKKVWAGDEKLVYNK